MAIKKITFSLLFIFYILICHAQQDVKNVIMLIPDGASADLLSLTRWYNGSQKLSVDELICGMVKTHSADSTIADSAPSGTAYATGYKSRTKYIGVDQNKVPRISVLELAKLKGMETGVVVTCQFQHATPADYVCHYTNRDSYDILSKQFIYNSPSVVFGGGYKYIAENNLLPKADSLGIRIITDKKDFDALSNSNQKPIWALFNDWSLKSKYLSYNCDRNEQLEPSLAEMTLKAIQLLSKNENGFFLLVEGSQVDWAAHVNDPKAIVSEFLAFDQSVAVALEFAKTNGNTVVIVCPDHGNGGISIGNYRSGDLSSNPQKYDKVNIHTQIAEPLQKVKHSSRWVVESILEKMDGEGNLQFSKNDIVDFVSKNYSISLTIPEVQMFLQSLKWVKTNSLSNSKAIDDTLSKVQVMLGRHLSNEVFIGWTTTGHTAEDVFLGIYHPSNEILKGVVDNTEIANYIKRILNLGSTETLYANSFFPINTSTSFKNWKIIGKNPLVFRGKDKTLITPYNTNHYILNGKRYNQSTLTIAIDGTVYVSKEVFDILINP
jgi:alkaline phosphatase